jgi:hypothetical protein
MVKRRRTNNNSQNKKDKQHNIQKKKDKQQWSKEEGQTTIVKIRRTNNTINKCPSSFDYCCLSFFF